MRKIYIDMDGVLAAFHKRYDELYNEEAREDYSLSNNKKKDAYQRRFSQFVEGRNFADPVMLFALVEVGPQESPTSDLGVDFTWTMTFRFLRDDLLSPTLDFNASMSYGFNLNPLPGTYGAELHPEVGDIIQYQNGYWEVDNTNATQFFTGKDPQYPYTDANGNNPLNPGLDQFGYNVEVRCDCHYVPSDRLNIIKSRM